MVVRLRLCPYAAEPYVDDQIRYAVSAATDDEALLEDFFLEGALLLDAPPELATTMLVAPQYAGDIEQFYALYEWLTDTLEEARGLRMRVLPGKQRAPAKIRQGSA